MGNFYFSKCILLGLVRKVNHILKQSIVENLCCSLIHKNLQCEDTVKIQNMARKQFYVDWIRSSLFGLRLNVPVNNFSVMLGRSHPFLGFNQYSWELMCPAQQYHGTASRTQDHWIWSPMLYDYPTTLPVIRGSSTDDGPSI